MHKSLLLWVVVAILWPFQAYTSHAASPVRNCISIVGDSIPEGRLVVMVPGHGFPVLKTASMAEVLQTTLAAYGVSEMPVYDRSVGAANLSDLGVSPYTQTDTYRSLLSDQCRLILIFPWNNDLNVVHPNGATDYVEDIARFVQRLRMINPHGHVVVMTHYWGQPQSFVPGFGVGVTVEHYLELVQVVAAACAADGRLRMLGNVSCLETQPIFGAMGNSFVILERTQDELMAILNEAPPPEVQDMLDVFWRENAGASVSGDGVHLSPEGKAALAEGIIQHLLSLDALP